MKHVCTMTRRVVFPARSSLLEIQQKITTLGAFAGVLGTFGEAIGVFVSLGDS